jgi:SAM-dependent methyltransferase
LPYLKPGMVLLDLGCGPGSITVGLAAAVAPGSATGVDLDPGLPSDADGVTLVQADVNDLPFPDATFDAVFACALLQHLPDPLPALREARRVARPGAMIGVADIDTAASLIEPVDPWLAMSFEVSAKLRAGSPHTGRRLPACCTRPASAAASPRRGHSTTAIRQRPRPWPTSTHPGTPHRKSSSGSWPKAWPPLTRWPR